MAHEFHVSDLAGTGCRIVVFNSMTLAAGTRLGPYEVVAKPGAGGTGEVYRARDNKLNREVALKILPPAFDLDADRLQQ